jgi:uncharacterized protein (TIGR01777 family)
MLQHFSVVWFTFTNLSKNTAGNSMESPKNILITGASGLIGTRLIEMLKAEKNIYTLSRSPKTKRGYGWDIDNRLLDPAAIVSKDAIIHLAGTSVADERWTRGRKNDILKSRTESTRMLYDALKKEKHSVKHFISASAIGYYGFDNEEKTYTEDSGPGKDFLAQVTKAWEDEVDRIASLGIRVVKIRIGIVLSEKGGALKEIANPVKYYVGAPLGSGKQPVSWIHLDDVCGMFVKALDDFSMSGAYNGVAPNPVTNRTLTKTIGKALKKPVFLPAVPGFVLKMVLGEMANVVVKGNTISADKILSTDYKFKFENIEDAVGDLLKKKDQ